MERNKIVETLKPVYFKVPGASSVEQERFWNVVALVAFIFFGLLGAKFLLLKGAACHL